MRKRNLAIAAVVAAACLGAGSRVRTVDGIAVVGGTAILARPLVEIKNLRFYACKERITGKRRCLITGSIVSHLAHDQYLVILTFDTYEIYPQHRFPGSRGTVRVEIKRPMPERLTHFRVLGPEWRTMRGAREARPCYTVRADVAPLRPGQ